MKQPGDTKAPVQPTPSNEPPKQPKATEETMPKSEEEVEPAIDTKLTQKKGEPITKDLKKSRHYDVSHLLGLLEIHFDIQLIKLSYCYIVKQDVY